MSDFQTIQTRIANELALPSVAGRIRAAVLSAIRFYEQERFWFLEGEATAPTVAGQANYATPTDLLETDALTVTDGGTRHALVQRPWKWLRDRATSNGSAGRPDAWALYANEYWLYPVPDKVYTLTSSYLRRLTELSAGIDTNDWLTHGEELIRSRAKYDLLLHSAADPSAAAAMRIAADEARDNLLEKSHRKIRSGPAAVDRAIVGRGGFDINTG